eukprot:CAMPEP_0113503172 /NCGR_PEP_ID=MMETSP0014_2-20120614/33999_1 /TAXON_ID=2857 /ORGANISM="Nitzschia sp." /LENGTH=1272 /DNA_ID=CAMNT_0000398115 /DNA_START=467 /DNA_END=4285 /DNA_ORIENTATION=+ /assembly_acc=CAM_ASM_000159
MEASSVAGAKRPSRAAIMQLLRKISTVTAVCLLATMVVQYVPRITAVEGAPPAAAAATATDKLSNIPDVFAEHLSEGVTRDFQALVSAEHYNKKLHGHYPHKGRRDQDQDQDRGLQTDEDLKFCYDALFLSDENQNYEVDQDEYITFLQIMGPPGFVPDAETFGDLPLILQSNFIILACLCMDAGPDPDPQCCSNNPHISNNGTWPGQTPTPEQEQYLYQVCFLTETSIGRLMESLTPSAEPTEAPRPDGGTPIPPTPTAGPPPETDTPSVSPTGAPVTAEPTLSPTPPPTTRQPSDQPSSIPTPLPTGSPTTASPTQPEDTLAPTAVASDSPSMSPSEVVMPPSPSPATAEPTPEPTAGSLPTSSPAPTASGGPTPAPVFVNELAKTSYSIAINTGGAIPPLSSYVPDLVAAMDLLAVAVAVGWNAEQSSTTGKRKLLLGTAPSSTDSFSSSVLSSSSLRQQGRRRLVSMVEVDLPTAVDGITDISCLEDIDMSQNSCKMIDASMRLIVTLDGSDDNDANDNLEEAAAVRASYEMAVDTAIENGGLQAALNQVNSDSNVIVTTGRDVSPPSPTMAPTGEVIGDDGLSSGAIAGIAVGGGLLLVGAAIFAMKRPARNSKKDKSGEDKDEEDLNALEEADYDQELQHQYPPTYGGSSGGGSNAAGVATGVAAGAGVAAIAAAAVASTSGRSVSSSSGSPSKKKRTGSSGPLYSVPGAKGISDEGSSAGDSGWSSNQDLSSVDSKSVDKSLDSSYGLQPSTGASTLASVPGPAPSSGANAAAAAVGATALVGAAAVGAAAMNQMEESEHSSRDASSHGDTGTMSIQSTYSELDQAISKGDWAAVGVTAALLASQAYSTDEDSSRGTGTSSKPRLADKTSLNPQRAAELDALVEAGDWEGVVAAAAKFDAQEALRGDSSLGGTATGSAQSQTNDSPSGGSVGGSSTGTGPSFLSASGTLESTTAFTASSGAGLTATSDTASTRSKARKLNEIREEVEALVTAVVPEEADNVDEMMTQFRGREEELVETLRSMQERQVAQKARLESQKQAKRDAKANVEQQRKHGKVEAVDSAGNAADEEWMEQLDQPAGGALEPHTEDHEAEMKAQLKEAIENEDWQNVADAAQGLSGHIFSPTTTRTGTQDDMTTASDRSREMNDLVDRGDWDAVVAAASRYVEADTKVGQEPVDSSTAEEERRKRRQERLKEEEEALAQADIWNAIAEQTKSASAEEAQAENLAGANLAAAWAIDRSLNALNKAEKQDQQSGSDDADEVDREV